MNGPTHSTVEAGACWVHGWVRGRKFVCDATETIAGVRFQREGNHSGRVTSVPILGMLFEI